MTELTIIREEFPTIIPSDAKVGDPIVLKVTGVIRRIEGEAVDVSGYGKHESAIGRTEVEILVADIEREI